MREAFGLQRREGGVDARWRQCRAARASAAAVTGPEPFEASAHDLDERRLRRQRSSASRRASTAGAIAPGNSALKSGGALGGDPDAIGRAR